VIDFIVEEYASAKILSCLKRDDTKKLVIDIRKNGRKL